jgi:hypothetical protein
MSKPSEGIKLAPIRMTDLKPTTENAAALPQKKGYVPPNLRAGGSTAKVDNLPKNLDGMNFPSLGNAAPVQKTMPNFRKTVLDQIEREQLDELERNKVKEVDTSKMTREELEAAGWAVLTISRSSAMKAAERLSLRSNTPVDKED